MELIYKGADVTEDVEALSCYYETHADGHLDEVTIDLGDEDALWGKWAPQAGDALEVRDDPLRSGTFFVDRLSPGRGEIRLHAYPIPRAQIEAARNMSREDVLFTQLLEEACQRHGLVLNTYGVDNHMYKYVEQRGESDLAFLAKRCALEGCGMLVYDRSLVVYGQRHMEESDAAASFELDSGSGAAFHVNGLMCSRLVVTDGATIGSCESGEAGYEAVVRLDGRITDQEEADRFAANLLERRNRGAVTMKIESGSLITEAAPCSVVDVSSEGRPSCSGRYIVSRARHELVSETTDLWARMVK